MMRKTRIATVIRAGIDGYYVGTVSSVCVCVEMCACHQTASIEVKQIAVRDC
jgi:hypothetical protein